jgi:hypothetical protein
MGRRISPRLRERSKCGICCVDDLHDVEQIARRSRHAVELPYDKRIARPEQLRREGYPVRDEDAARLSPLVYEHINVLGRYSFAVPDAAATRSDRQPGLSAFSAPLCPKPHDQRRIEDAFLIAAR